MQAHPGQAIFASHQILIERLVLVPEEDETQGGHERKCQSSMGVRCGRKHGRPLVQVFRYTRNSEMPDKSTPAASDRITLLSDQDLYLVNEGSNYRMHETMGAHLVSRNGVDGAVFSVWAPNARVVSVIGSFNAWGPRTNLLTPRGSSGIWEGFVPKVTKGALYKFH